MVGARLDPPAGRQLQAERRLGATGERLHEARWHEAVSLVDRPQRNVARVGGHELAERDPRVGVGSHELRVGSEATAFAEVRQHWPLVASGFEVAAELAEGDDRHLELTGEDLEVAADLADFELPVLRVAATAHQLQVVDDDQRQPTVASLEAARLGPDLHHRDARVVVEEQRHLEATDRPADLRPVRLGQPAVAHLHRVDLGLAGQDALGQFVVTHLQREHEDRPARGLCDVRRHAQTERRVVEVDIGGDEVVQARNGDVDDLGRHRPA